MPNSRLQALRDIKTLRPVSGPNLAIAEDRHKCRVIAARVQIWSCGQVVILAGYQTIDTTRGVVATNLLHSNP
jgi:hypothetical protein